MKKDLFLILGTLLLLSEVRADVLLGTGMSSVTKGRTVPSLYMGIDKGSSVYNFYAVGIQTEIYYHSAYKVSYYQQTAIGQNKRVGFGIGSHYSVRGYRNDKDAKEEKVTDFTLGPGMRFCFDIGDTVFFSLETVYGVRNIMPLFLSFQNTNSMNFGVRF
tara:strand:- start:75 stop:554 length:480 start_codon:yes stop_codon:yes gene_type:complete